MKKIFSVILTLCMLLAFVPVLAEESGWSVATEGAALRGGSNGVTLSYASGEAVLNYDLEKTLSGLVSIEFDCALTGAQIKRISAYSESTAWLLYVDSARNLWGSTLNSSGDWTTESCGYDISEYGSAHYRLIIDTDAQKYSLYIDGYEQISDFSFIKNGDNLKRIQFTFASPITEQGAKAVIGNMSVKNVTEEQLEREEFGIAWEEQAGNEEKVQIYVSPEGDDKNTGSKENPFKTVAAAKEYAKELKLRSGMPKGGIDIILRGGEYRENLKFDMSDSGMENAPVRFKAYEGEKVFVTSLETVDTSLFESVDESAQKRLKPEASGKVWRLDLKKAGLQNKIEIPAMGQLGQQNTGTTMITVNGETARPASWPNEGYANVADVAEDGTLIFEHEDMADWQKPYHAWMHAWVNGWYDGSVRVKYNSESGGMSLYQNLAHGGIKKGAKVRFINVLEELDEAGEWYLDPEEQMLYIWLGESTEGLAVRVSTQKESLVKILGTKYIEFENIGFEAVRGDALRANGAYGVKILGCRFENIGAKAVVIENSAKCGVFSCDIKNTGRGGVIVSGGDRETLTKAENYVENTHISDFAEESKTAGAAVRVSGVGNYILNNRMNGGEHTAVFFSGNLNVIDKNEIYSVLTEADDAGAIYSGRSFVDRGNVISNNFIHGIEHGGGNNRMGIYLDDQLCGTTVTGNIVYDCNTAMLLHGGRDHTVKNNLSAECDQGITAIDWCYKEYLDDENYLMWQAYDASPYQTELWQNEFAHLYNLREDDPAEPKYNVISENLAVLCKKGDTASANHVQYGTVENNVATKDVSVISDMYAFDFSLNKNSSVLKENSFLKENLYTEMGLYSDEYRTEFPKLGDIEPKSPKNNSEDISSAKVDFSWEAADNASEYVFTLAEDENFKKIVHSEKLYGKNYLSVSGLKDNGDRYYWKVKALMNTANGTSEKESEVFSFTTEKWGRTLYFDTFDDGETPEDYSVGGDQYAGISVSDGKLVYERPSVGSTSESGLYRDVDIDLSKIRSEKLVVEYDMYPEQVRLDNYVWDFPSVADSTGEKYVNNYYDMTTKDLNTGGNTKVYHWSKFFPWNDGNTEDFCYKVRIVLDVKNNKQSVYISETPSGTETDPNYKGYSDKVFFSDKTDGTIKRIYFARPHQWSHVKISIDNFRVYEYKPLEITEVSPSEGTVLMSDTPKIDISFNSRIDEDTLDGISMEAENGEKPELSIDRTSENVISVRTKEPVEWGGKYTLKIPRTVTNVYRQGMDKTMVYNYTVRDNPTPEKRILVLDNFNGKMPEGYSYDGDSSEELKTENGMLKYNKSNTYGVLTSGLKKSVDIDMNTLTDKELTIEYDLYTYAMRKDEGWLMKFPEIRDENGKKYCSFYFEAPNKLVQYYKPGEAHEVGELLQGENVMYRVTLKLSMADKKCSAEFKRYNTETGALEDTQSISAKAFLEETSGKISDICIIEGYKWGSFKLGIDNFTVYCEDNFKYDILDADSASVSEISHSSAYTLSGEIKNSAVQNFVTMLAEFDGENRLIGVSTVKPEEYVNSKVKKEFVTKENTCKIKVFSWNGNTPVSNVYEWKEGIKE